MTAQPDPHENLLMIEDRNFDNSRSHRYIKGNFLGKGGFARCYELISEENKNIEAVKIIQKSSLSKPRSKQKLMSEIKIHQSLKHHHVVQFKHHFEDHMNVYIVLELCTNKTLNDLLKRKRRLSESQIKYYMLQVLGALEYLHSKHIIHRDLKLGNLFLNENMEIKMGDFGLATKLQFSGERKKTVCGTSNYIAPEILEGKGHSFEVDLWSFGVILYTLAFGRPPFESKDVKETYKKIKSGKFSFPQNSTISVSLRNTILSTLQKQPHKRPTCTELKSFDFFVGVSLTRQPSISFRAQTSLSVNKDQKQLSDNGKLYTNNDLMISKDTARQKSQDKFLATDRSASSIRHRIKKNIRRASSQRILKQKPENQMLKTIGTKSPNRLNDNPIDIDLVSVKKWIDYSSKYGIGYILSNDASGVYFNDSSKILAFNIDEFYYFEKISKEDVCHCYSFRDYPLELKKKVSLFSHFKGYLNGPSENNRVSSKKSQKDAVYVRRWYRAKHAVIFRLSNKSVQVIFVDQTQVLISSSKKKVVYTNKNRQKSEYWLNQIMKSDNRELIKRFEYTKQVLNEMANNHQKQLQKHADHGSEHKNRYERLDKYEKR